MEIQNCLNCGTTLNGKFCSGCGQSAKIHRISTGYFIKNELLHGVWNMDNKLLFTFKELFTRPGNAAKDYLVGKRKRYYNVFYFLLIVLGLNLLVSHYSGASNLEASGDGIAVAQFIQENVKLLIFSFIPFVALSAWLTFRKLKFNFAEHIIIAGFVILGCSIIYLFSSVVEWIVRSTQWDFLSYFNDFLSLVFFLFPAWAYFLVCKPTYTKLGFSWRILCFYLLFFLQPILCFLLYSFVNGGFVGSF